MQNKKIRCLLLLVLAATGAALFSGCATPQDSAVPWSRPADWEGQLPGMGGL